jgi:ADP-ribosylglycohydrolase
MYWPQNDLEEQQERYRGCLLGLAVGDALGTTVEFCRPGTFRPVTDMVGGGPFKLLPGQWTDDTSLALCLAESLVECGRFDPVDQLQRYVIWWREGYMSSNGTCFDIGGTTRTALGRFERTGEPWCGPTDISTAGNGSLMRLAPVLMFFAADPAAAIEKAGESSRTTHGALAAIDACRYYAGLIVGALGGADKVELLSAHYAPIAGYWRENALAEEIAEVAAGSFKDKKPPAIQGTGYVVESLEAALWCFYKSRDFARGCLLAVNLGDDADTTAAIYGQLAGAYYGMHDIPPDWLEKLAKRELIEGLADRLYDTHVKQP